MLTDVTTKVLTANNTVKLSCPEYQSGDKTEWTRNKNPLPQSDWIKHENGSITILYSSNPEVFGNYTCKNRNVSEKYKVVSKYPFFDIYYIFI